MPGEYTGDEGRLLSIRRSGARAPWELEAHKLSASDADQGLAHG